MLVGKFNILLKMLLPERMTSTSIICVKKDVESILETLNSFGEFHIEPSSQEDASIAEYNQSIQKVEERLLDVDGLIKQLVQEKTSLLGIFKTKQQIKVNVTADNWKSLSESTNQEILTLKEEIDDLEATLTSLQEKNADLKYIEKMLLNMDSMGADLETVGDLKLVYVTFASMPLKNIESFETALSTLPVFVRQCHLCQEEYFVCLVSAIKHKDEVERILRTYHAEIFKMPEGLPQDVGKAKKQIETQNKENDETIKSLNDKLKKIGEENKDRLAYLKETSENILALLNAEKKILQSGRLATVKGFVPEKKLKELTEKIDGMMHGKAVVLQNEAEVESPPTKIIHNRFIKPFEEITRLYGLPKYDEVDPTPFIAITFPILCGLMFGDLGHGLALLIGAGIGQTVITSGYRPSDTNRYKSNRENYLITYYPANPSDTVETPCRISGFTLNGGKSSFGIILYNPTIYVQKSARVDHIRIYNLWGRSSTDPYGGRPFQIWGEFFGVMDNCVIGEMTGTYITVDGVDAMWKTAGGTFDYGSANMFFFEDNLFYGVGGYMTISSEMSARFCVRHNKFDGAGMTTGCYPLFDAHGNQPNAHCATMGDEIYANTVENKYGMEFFDHRGGKALVYNNNVTLYAESIYTDVREEYNDGCCVAYNPPINTVGQPQHPSDSYYWGNTINGAQFNPHVAGTVDYSNTNDPYYYAPLAYKGIVPQEEREFWHQNDSFDGSSGIGVGRAGFSWNPVICARASVCTMPKWRVSSVKSGEAGSGQTGLPAEPR